MDETHLERADCRRDGAGRNGVYCVGFSLFSFLPHIGIEMIRTKSGSGSAGKRGEKGQEEGEKRELSKKNKVHLSSTGSVQMQMRSWVDPGKD
jgi:hypothetical protein